MSTSRLVPNARPRYSSQRFAPRFQSPTTEPRFCPVARVERAARIRTKHGRLVAGKWLADVLLRNHISRSSVRRIFAKIQSMELKENRAKRICEPDYRASRATASGA